MSMEELKELKKQLVYSSEFVTLGSTGSVCSEEGWFPEDVC
jgi:hypothetical protein